MSVNMNPFSVYDGAFVDGYSSKNGCSQLLS